MAPPAARCSLSLLLLVLFCFLLHQVAAAASENSVYDVHDDDAEFAVYAPNADHLAARETHFQRWLSHVRRTSSSSAAHSHQYNQARKRRDSQATLSNSLIQSETSSTLFANISERQPTTTIPGALNRKHRHVCEKHVIQVKKDGSGNFTTIQAAINSVRKRNKCRVDIIIGAGVFREKVTIRRSKPHITLKGDPHRHTIISWNDTASSFDRKGRQLRTMYSATVAINSNYFVAKNIIFMNMAPTQRPGAVAEQAVALRISGDKAAFFSCRFYSHQDTLYDHHGRHYFHHCYVIGTVDFIFGNGRSLYEGTQLVVLDEHHGIPGAITAQKRSHTTPDTGFSFVNSRITGAGMVYLGRAWGNDSRVVFANTYMDKIVVPEGWGNWGVPTREKTVFYGQFNCTGPGADMSRRVHWSRSLTAAEAAPFLTPRFINGEKWLEGYKHKTHAKKLQH